MARRVEFFFDYGSPFSYLADARLPALLERAGAGVVYRPMLLGAVFKATGNRSPAFEPCDAKRSYTGTLLRRTAQRYAVPFRANPHFPIDTLRLMRLAVAAQRSEVFEPFHRAVFPAFWSEGLDLGDEAVVRRVLEGAGLEAAALLAEAAGQPVKDALRANTDEAVARGAFGAPSFFVGEELYFGADHMDFLEAALAEGR